MWSLRLFLLLSFHCTGSKGQACVASAPLSGPLSTGCGVDCPFLRECSLECPPIYSCDSVWFHLIGDFPTRLRTNGAQVTTTFSLAPIVNPSIYSAIWLFLCTSSSFYFIRYLGAPNCFACVHLPLVRRHQTLIFLLKHPQKANHWCFLFIPFPSLTQFVLNYLKWLFFCR